MEAMDYWRLCDDLTVSQAALLMTGNLPEGEFSYVEEWETHKRPLGYEAVKAALIGAVNSKALKARIIKKARYQHHDENYAGEFDPADFDEEVCQIENTNLIIKSQPDWEKTTLCVKSLKSWLSDRGFTTGFFFNSKAHTLPYLDDNNAYYAPKLAAAIKAWEEVSANEQLLNNCSPKQALTKWLEVNGHKFGLTTAFDEIAKIANWQTKGGAPTTVASPLSNHEPAAPELDDEIAF